MAEWIIRWGIPLSLVVAFLAAVIVSGGRPSTVYYDLLNALRSAIHGAIPRIL
jgi:hypothetical protein